MALVPIHSGWDKNSQLKEAGHCVEEVLKCLNPNLKGLGVVYMETADPVLYETGMQFVGRLPDCDAIRKGMATGIPVALVDVMSPGAQALFGSGPGDDGGGDSPHDGENAMYQADLDGKAMADHEKAKRLVPDDAFEKGERDLMDIVTGSLDWDVIEKLLEEKYGLSLQDDIEFKEGHLTVKEDRIAYQMDFQARITLSLMIGRDGRCVDVVAGVVSPDDASPDTE